MGAWTLPEQEGSRGSLSLGDALGGSPAHRLPLQGMTCTSECSSGIDSWKAAYPPGMRKQ